MSVDASITVKLPAKDGSGRIVRMYDYRSVNTEVKVFSSFGMTGGRAEIIIYELPKVLNSLCPNDPMQLVFANLDPDHPILLRVINCKWTPPPVNRPGAWGFLINAEFESSAYLRRKPAMSITSEKQLNYKEVVEKMLENSADVDDEEPVTVYAEEDKLSPVYGYTSYFLDGETRLREAIEDLVEENNAEWYCDPFTTQILVGSPVATGSTGGGCEISDGINRRKIFEMAGQWFLAFVYAGNAANLVGNALMVDGERWKIIKAVHGEKGNGMRETTGIAIRNDSVCGKATVQRFSLDPIDQRQFYEKERQTKVVDIIENEADYYENVNKAKWLKDKIEGQQGERPEKDPRTFEFLDGAIINNSILSSPYAGNEVGMKFPSVEGGRHLIIFPDKKNGYSILTSMIWKYEDAIPTCEPKDLYLRMEKGSLYFDEANKTWLVKADKIKLEAASPDAADTKPDTTTTSGTFIKLEKDGGVIVEGTTVKLGKEASEPVARNGDSVIISNTALTTFLTGLNVGTLTAQASAFLLAVQASQHTGTIQVTRSKVKTE